MTVSFSYFTKFYLCFYASSVEVNLFLPPLTISSLCLMEPQDLLLQNKKGTTKDLVSAKVLTFYQFPPLRFKIR
jgi:hypothetical protein